VVLENVIGGSVTPGTKVCAAVAVSFNVMLDTVSTCLVSSPTVVVDRDPDPRVRFRASAMANRNTMRSFVRRPVTVGPHTTFGHTGSRKNVVSETVIIHVEVTSEGVLSNASA